MSSVMVDLELLYETIVAPFPDGKKVNKARGIELLKQALGGEMNAAKLDPMDPFVAKAITALTGVIHQIAEYGKECYQDGYNQGQKDQVED